MSIKIDENNLKNTIRYEYIKFLKEEAEQEIDSRMANKIAFDIAEKLVHLVKKEAASNGMQPDRLLSFVFDQAKLQVKE